MRQAVPMPETAGTGPLLLLGPLLRHVDPVSATIWVETDRSCDGHGARPPGAHVLRQRPPLRAGRGRGPGAGQHARPTRCTSTAAGLAAAALGVPAQPDPHLRPARPVPAGVRLVPLRHARPPPTSATPSRRTRWTAYARQMAGDARGRVARRAACCSATRSTPTSSPPATTALGVRRRRDLSRAAGRPGRGLRGVHPALPASPGATRRCAGCCPPCRRR